ncbi:MAG: hypothetical protein IJ833_02165 [Lachnospiraceae bacterium]|nr:hypothetical protein [Lachnospiraceae bacterium]
MGLFHGREEEEEYNNEDFCFEDIIVDEPPADPDLEIYEDEFEMEPYLDGVRESLPKREEAFRPVYAIGIAVGLLVILITVVVLIWVALHREQKGQETNLPTSTPVVEMQTTDESKDAEAPDTNLQSEAPEQSGEDGKPDEDGQPDEDEQTDDTVAQGEEAVSFTVEPTAPISGGADMEFVELTESVTALDAAYIHTVPDTQDVSYIVAQIVNGQTVTRTGMNEATGWSRIDYNGEPAYIITSYLTTDLTYQPLIEEGANRLTTQDGNIVLFADCDDMLEATETVKLRTEPSTAAGNETVYARINQGVTVHRTGVSPDSGWSRVEYGGETVYVVTAYMQGVED